MLNSRMSTSESEWPKMHEANIITDLIKSLMELQCAGTKIYKARESTFIRKIFVFQVNKKRRMMYLSGQQEMVYNMVPLPPDDDILSESLHH